jgi:hypothetical protein
MDGKFVHPDRAVGIVATAPEIFHRRMVPGMSFEEW